MTLLTDPVFTRFAEVLGYSMIKQNIRAKKIIMVLRTSHNEQLQRTLEKVGWQVKVVDLIPQPGKQASTARFRTMFTKLRVWSLTDECDRAIMMDLDTITLKNFEELFYILPESTRFAAAPDNFFGKYKFEINAGVFVCKPDQEEFQRLTIAMNDTSKYDHNLAEQAFLSNYYGLNILRLPFIYNANAAIEKFNKADWVQMESQIKIMHFTVDKPYPTVTKTGPNTYWYNAASEYDEWSKNSTQIKL